MKTICLYFQLHQPVRLRRYRFFDIGKDHYYYDDYLNESTLSRLAKNSYLPANRLLLDLMKKYPGKFFVTFSISSTMIDQMEVYCPEVIDSFKQLAQTGQVEFLGETNAHSLVSLRDPEEFGRQVKQHVKHIEKLFGQTPTTFRNTELIYSDMLGADVAQMGFKTILAEGSKQVLGWKSPNFLYCNAIEPRLKVMLKNFVLSDDLAFRFGNQSWNEWPLTAEKYLDWIQNLSEKEELINLFMNYETLGENQKKETGIFEFLRALVEISIGQKRLNFATASKISASMQPISAANVPLPTSWADEERDLSAWLGNEMQNEAIDKLYQLTPLIQQCTDGTLLKDWQYLQASDHFYYMSTKFFSSGISKVYQNPYDTPYDAFINYMNVLTDFSIQLKNAVHLNGEENLVDMLRQELMEKEDKIKKLEKELQKKKSNTKTKKTEEKEPLKKKKTAVKKD